ncbi:unnamed protein product [Mytilus coruscus]|uniref:Uncharacterized protein n=1 Tax=Mytilus coruscus TaxID=42192 RepID=A0A6J7ZY80_MYTCO|nr:unnamed protein product [Mytilus coruscus]
MMLESQNKPKNTHQKLQLQRMHQEMKIQKLQQELEERKLQQVKLQQMLALQQSSVHDPAPTQLNHDPIGSGGMASFDSHGQASLKALPMDAMMQTLRSRMNNAGAGSSSSLIPDLSGLKGQLDAIGFHTPGPSAAKPFDVNSLMPKQAIKAAQPATNKHTINITVKRKTKVDVPGLPVNMAQFQKHKPAAQINSNISTKPAAITPELLSMLEALRAGNAASPVAASPAATQTVVNTAPAAVPVNVARQTPAMTMGALTGAPSIQQVNPLANMVQAAAAVQTQQAGAVSGNMLASAVTAKKASNTMADMLDTQLDAMSDMAEAGMGFGMMNMMSGMNVMGGMMGGGIGGGMGGGMGGMSGMGGMGAMGAMGGMGGMSGMGGMGGMVGGGAGGMGNGMGVGGVGGVGFGGLGMNRMMTSTFMSPMMF